MALFSISVNQRLPFGPVVMPKGPSPDASMLSSKIAWVLGLMLRDMVAVVLGEPEVAVGAGGDAERLAVAVGMTDSLMTPVVTSNSPIWLPWFSVNQILPSGPAVSSPRLLAAGRDGELGDQVGGSG